MQAIENEESPVLNTSELARLFDYSPPGMRDRLRRIDTDYVQSRDCGGVTIWWLTDRGRAYLEGEIDADELQEDDGG